MDIKYPLLGADGKTETNDYLVVATTRQKTMLG
jgi:valyl-tRNA synthetase